jgi:hypothetical protein
MRVNACLTIALSALGFFTSTEAKDYKAEACDVPHRRRCRTQFIIDECTPSGKYIYLMECAQGEQCKYCQISHGSHYLAPVANLEYRPFGRLPICESILCTGQREHNTVEFNFFPGLGG